MASITGNIEARGALREFWDALLIVLAVVHGIVLVLLPVLPVIAIGVWWNSNTISHYFIHRPFFRSRTINFLFACYLSVLLGIPQSLWRDRHLAHHAGVNHRFRLRSELLVETVAILTLWIVLAVGLPWFFLTVYLPGYLLGLGLCYLHGHYEHAAGTTSHYGFLYNWLFFNDGYHVEHHAHPGTHWTRLPKYTQPGVRTSRWPAVLRWLDWFSLETLERFVIRRPLLQRLLLRTHEQAWRQLLPHLGAVRRVGIVGGGLFPRTVLILQRLLPDAELVVIDGSAKNIETARTFITHDVTFLHAWYHPAIHTDFNLLVIPLSFAGNRHDFYANPPPTTVVVHDWLWRRRGNSAVVSWLLFKRLNLLQPH